MAPIPSPALPGTTDSSVTDFLDTSLYGSMRGFPEKCAHEGNFGVMGIHKQYDWQETESCPEWLHSPTLPPAVPGNPYPMSTEVSKAEICPHFCPACLSPPTMPSHRSLDDASLLNTASKATVPNPCPPLPSHRASLHLRICAWALAPWALFSIHAHHVVIVPHPLEGSLVSGKPLPTPQPQASPHTSQLHVPIITVLTCWAAGGFTSLILSLDQSFPTLALLTVWGE